MLADQTISDLRADLLQIYDALDGRDGPFDIGALRDAIRDVLRALSRATSQRIDRPARATYRTAGEVLTDLLTIRVRLEDLLMTGLVAHPTMVADLGPALFDLSRAVTGLALTIAHGAAARLRVAG